MAKMTEEEKVAAKERRRQEEIARVQSQMANSRPGARPVSVVPHAQPKILSDELITKGIELSEIRMLDPATLTPDPANTEFDADKGSDPNYRVSLKRDIAENGILDPIIITSNRMIVAGHERTSIAKELNLRSVPVRVILTNLSPTDIQKRRRLDNLLRFNIQDPDRRLSLFAQIWPDFFTKPGSAGRPVIKSNTGSYISNDAVETTLPINEKTSNGSYITAEDMAETLGVSVGKIQKDRRITTRAAEIAKASGSDELAEAHIKQAREEENQKRRTRQSPQKPQSPISVDEIIVNLCTTLSTEPIKDPTRLSAEFAGILLCAEQLYAGGYITDDAMEKITSAATVISSKVTMP